LMVLNFIQLYQWQWWLLKEMRIPKQSLLRNWLWNNFNGTRMSRDYHGLPSGKGRAFVNSHVALNILNFLQFFSLKSVEKWLSYTSSNFEGPSPSSGHMAQHLVAAGMLNLEIIQIGQLGPPKAPLCHQLLISWAKTWWGCRILNSSPF
jgi:hypothetical protein